jgi:hypothetical protein
MIPGGASAVFACVLAFAASTPAYMVAVYSHPGEPMKPEEMRAFALAVKEDPDARSESFTAKVSDKAVLSAEFSVPPGVSAYFWSDETFVRDGYAMAGEAAQYESFVPSSEDVPSEATGVTAPEKVFATLLRQASLSSSGGLTLAYSVATAGQVGIEAVGINGQRFGKWRVTEAAAGEYVRAFSLNAAAKGPIFVRWTYRDVETVKKVIPATRD